MVIDPMRVGRAFFLRFAPPRKRRCLLCGRACRGFLPYRGGWAGSPRAMRALGVVGSDLQNFECPWCGCHDRERHLLAYLRACRLWNRLAGSHILHFAPERRLAPMMAAMCPARHVLADLFPSTPGVERIDIQAIPYPEASFDLVIANHVLEHVDDDIRSIREVARVLRPGGHAILQVPFSARLHTTLSDPGIDDERARRELYGQEDHQRLFGRDVVERFVAASSMDFVGGSHAELLPELDAGACGVNSAEPFFLFRKP